MEGGSAKVEQPAIPILFEDEWIIVVSKPAGVTVNRSDTTREQYTLQDWAESKLKIESGKLKVDERGLDKEEGEWDKGKEFLDRGGIVHRLDKETSGVMLIAKAVESFTQLQSQFKDRVIDKTYIALAHGSFQQQAGEIVVPVGRLPWNRKRFGIIAEGREATTEYKVLKNLVLHSKKKSEPATLVQLHPKTGRTHQIRVHLKHINHPIVSDFLYAGRKTARDDRTLLDRVFLHAASISFVHPITKKPMTFSTPLPRDLEEFLSNHTTDRL